MRSCTTVPAGSIVFLRTGMDVPLHDGAITDASRIEETRPTIDVLRTRGCKIVIATHIGRPKAHEPALSAKPVADYLSKIYPTKFVPAVTGPLVRDGIKAMAPADVLVIENLRYDKREEANDTTFAQELVADVDCIVQDAYGNAHRAHASMSAALQYKPAYAGLLLAKEIEMVSKLATAEHPYVAIIGGAKADKLSTIKGLLPHVDTILVGGVLANTFLKALGFPVGDSKTDDTGLALARELYISGKILLPVDAVVADRFAEDSPAKIIAIGAIQRGLILDIGPETQKRYVHVLASARTIVWAGPIGVFEWNSFAEGTRTIASAVALSTGYTLAAGGDSGAALVALGYRDNIGHISTGGGATLELLEGVALPAVTALQENEKRFPYSSGDIIQSQIK